MPDLPVLPDSQPDDDARPFAAATEVEAASAPAEDGAPSAGVMGATATAAAADAVADEGRSGAPPPSATTAVPGGAAPGMSPAACADLLKQHFPALFTGGAKPLKLRIQTDIQQRAPGVFSKAVLSAFFRRYTGSTSYLMALSKASQRFDLDGQPAGELSDEHRQLARDELARRRQLTRDREQQAHAQQQAQQAEVLQARQARAALLRDFQRTTLTLANFCALKGMTPEALNPLLDQARREAAEAPPALASRPAADRRGPPGPRHDDRRPGPQGDRPRQRPEGRQADGRPGRPPRRPTGQS